MINVNIAGPQGAQGISGSNLLGNSKWILSVASGPEDVNPVDGYFKYFDYGGSLQLALNALNINSFNVLDFLTSVKNLSQTESLAITVVQADNSAIYKSGVVTNISNVYSTGSGAAAIIATSVLNSSGSFTDGKEYFVLVNVKGDQGFQGTQGIQGVQGFQGRLGHQGIQGHQGVSGGPQGSQGPQGFQGDRGNVGNPGVRGVTGSQGPQGVQGMFGGPQGYQGAAGPQGVQGNPQGPQGDQGPEGSRGNMGFQGPQGSQGFQGHQGNQGVAGGPQGFQGMQGFQGAQGVQGIFGGPQGNQGTQGTTGVQGYQGYQGSPGNQGTQGTQGFQGVPGFVGAQGIQGVQGAVGAQGPQGFQGNQGNQGLQGLQGAQGAQGEGVQGLQGTTGSQGVQGVQGVQGSQGLQGVQGNPQGPQGPQGAQGAGGGTGSAAYVASGSDPAVSLLLHMDGSNNSTSFIDKSFTVKTAVVVGDAKLSTATSKFGSSSAYFDGNGDYIYFPYSEDFNLSSNSYTIEGWVNPSSLSSTMGVISKHQSGVGADWMFYIMNSTEVGFFANNSTTFTRTVPTISTGTWYHFAVVRSAATGLISIYWNGTLAGSTISAITGNSGAAVGIGADRPLAPMYFFNGYIDEVRVTKGVARYTSNFTPPTAAFLNADGSLSSSDLPAAPSVGDIVFSDNGFYTCSSASPVVWKYYPATSTTINP